MKARPVVFTRPGEFSRVRPVQDSVDRTGSNSSSLDLTFTLTSQNNIWQLGTCQLDVLVDRQRVTANIPFHPAFADQASGKKVDLSKEFDRRLDVPSIDEMDNRE